MLLKASLASVGFSKKMMKSFYLSLYFAFEICWWMLRHNREEDLCSSMVVGVSVWNLELAVPLGVLEGWGFKSCLMGECVQADHQAGNRGLSVWQWAADSLRQFVCRGDPHYYAKCSNCSPNSMPQLFLHIFIASPVPFSQNKNKKKKSGT